MRTVLPDAQPPADLPVWARLQLSQRGIPIEQVAEWARAVFDPDLIAVILNDYTDFATLTRTAV
ncbi:hypothetical protein [Kitasatospora sp. NPDC058046]|uniref:hypothetical protein n=1 Tax=Kitasatospora sp. NPDC058046 TaxID=3346312 RepID=UPI0036D7F8C2